MSVNFTMSVERKLTAIMFTDIAGYTSSMSKSELKSLELLKNKRSILKLLLKKYKGTFIKEMGDGTLSYFDSAVNAATCAVKLQEQTYDDDDMNIRVGIHVGDIVFKDGDVFGDGVNVASRLESIAPKGGVCVSKNVYDELLNHEEFDGVELGLQSLKGVGRLVEVFGLKGDKLNEPNPDAYQDNKITVHNDDEVPSIAIIPFDNKGANEDAFYAYGISCDLISDVQSAGLIRVPSLKRVEEVTDLGLDEKATKLDVRYMVEGTLWKMHDIFQLSVELYDFKESKVIWLDRWQEKWDNLSTIRYNLSNGLLKVLDMKSHNMKKVETINTEAYELYLKGKYRFDKQKTQEDMNIARALLDKSIKLDNNLLEAKNLLGNTYSITEEYNKAMHILEDTLKQAETLNDRFNIAYSLVLLAWLYEWTGINEGKVLPYIKRGLEISEELGDEFSIANSLGELSAYYHRRCNFELGMKYSKECLTIMEQLGEKKNISLTLMGMAEIYCIMGEYEKCIETMNKSFQIGKEIGNLYWEGVCHQVFGTYYYFTGAYIKALDYLEKAIDIMLNHSGENLQSLDAIVMLALTKKAMGRKYNIDEAAKYVNKSKKDFWFYHYYAFYLLFENEFYLKSAYDQIMFRCESLEPKMKKTLLSYDIPKAIVEEWETLNKKKN